jgi:hypothetical protein
VEKAKSSHATCQNCLAQIPKGQLRVGIKKTIYKGTRYTQRVWFHTTCFEGEFCALASVHSFQGHENLNQANKAKLAKFVAEWSTRKSTGKVRTTRKKAQEVPDGEEAKTPQSRYAQACRVVVAQFVHQAKQKIFGTAEGRYGPYQATFSAAEKTKSQH